MSGASLVCLACEFIKLCTDLITARLQACQLDCKWCSFNTVAVIASLMSLICGPLSVCRLGTRGTGISFCLHVSTQCISIDGSFPTRCVVPQLEVVDIAVVTGVSTKSNGRQVVCWNGYGRYYCPLIMSVKLLLKETNIGGQLWSVDTRCGTNRLDINYAPCHVQAIKRPFTQCL